MHNNEDFLELNPKDLLFYILYRWKPIVLGAIVFALLLGCFMAYPEYKSSTSPETAASLQEDLQNYEEQVAFYTKRIDMTRLKIAALQDYMDFSILMNTDHRNVFIAKSTYYVDTNYQILPENVYQDPNKTATVTWYYQDYLNDYSVYTPLAQQLGIEEKYLMELVTVTRATVNTASISVAQPDQATGGTFSISVAHPDQAAAETILAYLDQALLQYQNELTSIVTAHTLTQMLHTCGNYISEPLAQKQMEEATKMLTLQDELTLHKKELTQFQKNNTPVSINVISTFVKWCVLGGLVGGVLLVVLFFFVGIFDNRAYAPDYVASHYHLVPLGDVLPNGQKYDIVTAWLRRQECLLTKNSQENYDYLAANIQNHCSTVTELLVCSDADTETTHMLISALQSQLPEIHFHTAGNLLRDANALKQLPKCDSVLLVISGKQTRQKQIVKSLAQIRDCAKEVLGFIYVG